MKEFIDYLIRQIVSKPESLRIDEEQDPETNTHIYRINVAQDDMGMIIGKEGRTIKSLRNLARAKAIKDGIRINIELNEATEGARGNIEEDTQPETQEPQENDNV